MGTTLTEQQIHGNDADWGRSGLVIVDFQNVQYITVWVRKSAWVK